MDSLVFAKPDNDTAPDATVFGELRALLKLAAPIAAAQAGLALMGLTDTAVVGRVGAVELGAVGIGNGIFFGIGVIGLGMMMGFDPLIAQAVGAGKRDHARALLFQSGWLALFATLLLSIPIALAPMLLVPAGVPPEVVHDARLFILCRLPGLFPMLLFTGTRAYLQGLGRVRALVISTVIANIANLILDVLFVFGKGPIPAMGIAGAGLATSLCSAIQFGALAWDARAKTVGYRGPRMRLAPDVSELNIALRIGFPVGLQLGAETGVFALAGILAGRLGALDLAAHQVALALASFTFCFALGIGNAASVRIGWAIGARDQAAVRRRGFVALGAAVALMSCFAIAFLFFPAEVARLLSDRSEVVETAAPLLAIAAVFQIADGIQAVGAGLLRGAGDTRFPFFANLFGHYAIGLPIALYCCYSLGRGVIGIWSGLSTGLFAVAASLFFRFVWLSGRKLEPIEASEISTPEPRGAA